MVEISEFCQRVLLSPSLEEKLRDPGSLTDERPVGLSTKIERPQRTAEIDWEQRRSERGVSFPKLHQLHEPKVRGQVLHFFANHELLALELMGYQLLRFPDAPKSFRIGLAQTMRDEQKHMRMYLSRMLDWSVQFGEHPLSGYFWSALAEVSSPLNFVAGMSLTFEQANLDFASYFSAQFRHINDESTAAILDQVLLDEMKHVRHGLHWFETWRNPEVSPLEAHRSLLHYPLNLSRAKGLEFRSDLRLEVGLTRAYIDELEVLNFSKGRLPTLYVFNPSCESEIVGSTGFNPNRSAENLRHDLETLVMLFAARGDMVWVSEAPRPGFLRRIDSYGLVIPEFIVSAKPGREALKFGFPQQKLAKVAPWGRSPVVLRSLRFVADTIPSNCDRSSASPWQANEAERYSKSKAADLLGSWYEQQTGSEQEQNRLSPSSNVGCSCTTIEELRFKVEECQSLAECVVIKGAFGSSGRAMIRCFSPRLEAAQEAWVRRMLQQQGSVVVEPWLDRVCDLSARYLMDGNGEVVLQSIGQFLTDQRGQFRGLVIARMNQGLDHKLQRFIHDDGQDPNWMESFFVCMGKWIAEQWTSYPQIGSFAVDALIHRDSRDASRYRLKPIVEINPRYTMGHIADRLRPRLSPRSIGILNIVRIKDFRSDGLNKRPSEVKLAVQTCVEKHRPIIIKDGKKTMVENGVVFLTDVDRAREFAVVLSVDSSLKGCCDRLLEIFGPRACIPPYLRET